MEEMSEMEAESRSQARRLFYQLPPGSGEAVKHGCTCPVMDNAHGAGLGNGLYWISGGCPLHGLEKEREG